jgi:hypothetical protein
MMCDVPSMAVFVRNLLSVVLVLFPGIIIIIIIIIVVVVVAAAAASVTA